MPERNDLPVISDTLTSQKQLLHLLDVEINQIFVQERRPGWTLWALYGSIAMLFWLLLSYTATYVYNISNVLILIIVFSLFLDFIEVLLSFSSVNDVKRGETRIIYLSRVAEGGRLSLFLKATRFLLIYVLIRSFPAVIDKFSYNSISIVYLIYTIAISIFLILSFMRVPLIFSSSKQWGFFPSLGIVIPALITGYAILNYYQYLQTTLPSIADWKTSAIIVAMGYLVIILSSQKKSTPLLSSLITIRRNFCLGKMSYEEAQHQTDMALLGLQINDLLQEYVKDLLESFNQLNSKYDEIIRKINAFKSELPENLEDLTDEKRTILEAFFNSINPNTNDIKKLLDVAKKERRAFNLKLIFFKIAKEFPKEIQEIENKFENELDTLDDKLKQVSEGVDLFKKAMCAGCKNRCDNEVSDTSSSVK